MGLRSGLNSSLDPLAGFKGAASRQGREGTGGEEVEIKGRGGERNREDRKGGTGEGRTIKEGGGPPNLILL